MKNAVARCLGFIAALQAAPAFASQEGGAIAGAVLLIVGVIAVALVACVGGGLFFGAYQASRKGEPILKGSAYGVLKGIVAFLVLGVVSTIVLTVLGGLYVAYALATTY